MMTIFIRKIPEGDDRERLNCPDCGHVAYENPKMPRAAPYPDHWPAWVLTLRFTAGLDSAFWRTKTDPMISPAPIKPKGPPEGGALNRRGAG